MRPTYNPFISTYLLDLSALMIITGEQSKLLISSLGQSNYLQFLVTSLTYVYQLTNMSQILHSQVSKQTSYTIFT
jgi:hypothetical protein